MRSCKFSSFCAATEWMMWMVCGGGAASLLGAHWCWEMIDGLGRMEFQQTILLWPTVLLNSSPSMRSSWVHKHTIILNVLWCSCFFTFNQHIPNGEAVAVGAAIPCKIMLFVSHQLLLSSSSPILLNCIVSFCLLLPFPSSCDPLFFVMDVLS